MLAIWQQHRTAVLFICGAALVYLAGCFMDLGTQKREGAQQGFTELTYEDAIEELQSVTTDEESSAILERYPADVQERITAECAEMVEFSSRDEPWTGPAVDAVCAIYNTPPADIIAVQRMVFLDNGMPTDSVDAVITESEWYYVSLSSRAVTTELPASLRSVREIDIYGSGIQRVVDAFWCWNDEYVVVFYLPVCFYEIDRSRGHFDGILDAWAPNPSCAWNCRGGICALNQCGSAWTDPVCGPGYNCWWNFNTCSTDRWSKKVGKQIQKRWLYTWKLCHGRSNRQIAQSVRARIRY